MKNKDIVEQLDRLIRQAKSAKALVESSDLYQGGKQNYMIDSKSSFRVGDFSIRDESKRNPEPQF